jgi:hypothetical protein
MSAIIPSRLSMIGDSTSQITTSNCSGRSSSSSSSSSCIQLLVINFEGGDLLK